MAAKKKAKRAAKKKAKRAPKPRHKARKVSEPAAAPAPAPALVPVPVSPPSYLRKLDPALRLGAARAKFEKPLEAAVLPAPLVRPSPSSLSEVSVGIQALGSRMSAKGEARLLEKDLVAVLIDCSEMGPIHERVEAWGGGCARVSGTTMVARVPRTELESLARIDAVRYVEASTRMRLHLDLAHVSAGLMSAGARTVPQTGAGVIVGVVDTGIDVTHPGFRSGGKTRILNYLDQVLDKEFDSAGIDAGDANGSTDTVGHGTHVAGIAAGNGGGSPGESLRGVAYEADLAVVKSTLETADILAGIAHIFDIARKRDQPAVVNCSFGGHVGGHDGSAIIERTIDQLSGEGLIVVVSAGNEGGDPIHAHTVLRGDGGAAKAKWEASFALNARTVQGQSGPVQLGICLLQVWQQREDALRIRLRSPSGILLDAPEDGTKEHDFGSFLVNASRQIHPYSGDPFVAFEIVTLPQPQWLTGWTLSVEEESPGSSKVGAVHAWIADGSEGSFTSGATFDYVVGMPATSYSAVTVASYATRNEWKSRDPANPTIHIGSLELESLSSFSSRGPTRDGHTKPEVAAPGEWLLAPLSKDADLSELPLFTRASGIDYAALRGTSMSAPYVTGSLALLLEKDASIDWAEAKRRIIKSARQDVHTGVCWNPAWGYGKLDVERLLTIEPD
jgi:subtilisin family serine protease